jgi:hypothetical protein
MLAMLSCCELNCMLRLPSNIYHFYRQVDILDIYYVKGSTEPVSRWRKAQILKVVDSKISIHYCGHDTKYDEVLDILSDGNRIRGRADKQKGKNSPMVEGNNGKGISRKEANGQLVAATTTSSVKQPGAGRNQKTDNVSETCDDTDEGSSGSVVSLTESEIEREAERDRDFIKRMAACGMTIVPIEGDGNCLFRAVSYQLYLHENNHAILRKQCVEHLKLHRDRFEMFCDKNFDEHIEEMSKLGSWGDDMEIRALEEILDRIICIYSADTPDLNRPINQIFEESSILSDSVPLKLSYHGSNHYNSVGDKNIELPLQIMDTTTLLDTRMKLFSPSPSAPRK